MKSGKQVIHRWKGLQAKQIPNIIEISSRIFIQTWHKPEGAVGAQKGPIMAVGIDMPP